MIKTPWRIGIRVVLLVGCLWLTGCSTFDRDFKLARSAGESSDAMAGAWTGAWLSDYNGHGGKLRAIITQSAEEPDDYEARYHAVFFGFLTYEYTTLLHTKKGAAGKTVFEGAEDLGYAKEGVYHYEGHTDGRSFFSTYKANVDHGTYTMERP